VTNQIKRRKLIATVPEQATSTNPPGRVGVDALGVVSHRNGLDPSTFSMAGCQRMSRKMPMVFQTCSGGALISTVSVTFCRVGPWADTATVIRARTATPAQAISPSSFLGIFHFLGTPRARP
jgi:hypothetical protein